MHDLAGLKAATVMPSSFSNGLLQSEDNRSTSPSLTTMAMSDLADGYLSHGRY